MKQVQNDLNFLDDDIAIVERRHSRLLLSKDRYGKRVLVESPFYDLNRHPGRESTSTGDSVSVWRGGSGVASIPLHEEELYSAERLRIRGLACTSVCKDLEKAGCSLEDDTSVDTRGESAGVHKVAKKRRVLAQVYFNRCYSFQIFSHRCLREYSNVVRTKRLFACSTVNLT